MIHLFNNKTKKSHWTEKLLIVGSVSSSVRTITEYGFFAAMIHIDDGGPIPANRQFIVAEKIPDGWTGETITADQFAKTMNARIVKPNEKPRSASTPTLTSKQRTGRTIVTIPCCGGESK